MEVKVLKEYKNLCDERKDIETRISKIMIKLEEEKSTIVEDIVKGSSRHFPYVESNMHISGVDSQLIERKTRALRRQKELLEKKKIEIIEKEVEVEEFLANVEDSILRQIIRYKYIDELGWVAVGRKLRMSGDACRVMLTRFVEKCSFCS